MVLRFTPELAAMEPEAFVADVLMSRLRAREVVVGVNHRFGKGARGDAALLEALGRELGFSAHIVEPLSVGGVMVSSTAVRGALERGDVVGAVQLLGRSYAVAGEVVQGFGRGRTIGFPTANLKLDRALLVPTGVYACRASVDGVAHPAVTLNVGVRPTFGESSLAVEVHILDFVADLYGQHMTLEFQAHLRDERGLESVEALKDQIARDVASRPPVSLNWRLYASGGRGTIRAVSAHKKRFFGTRPWESGSRGVAIGGVPHGAGRRTQEGLDRTVSSS